MNETKNVEKTVVLKPFFLADFEAQEQWLNDMSKEGLALTRVSLPGVFEFVRGDAQNVTWQVMQLPFGTRRRDIVKLARDRGMHVCIDVCGRAFFGDDGANDSAKPTFFSRADIVENNKLIAVRWSALCFFVSIALMLIARFTPNVLTPNMTFAQYAKVLFPPILFIVAGTYELFNAW